MVGITFTRKLRKKNSRDKSLAITVPMKYIKAYGINEADEVLCIMYPLDGNYIPLMAKDDMEVQKHKLGIGIKTRGEATLDNLHNSPPTPLVPLVKDFKKGKTPNDHN